MTVGTHTGTHIPSPERIHETLIDGRIEDARELNLKAHNRGGDMVFRSRDHWLVSALVELATDDFKSARRSYMEACGLEGGPTESQVARHKRHLFRYYLRKRMDTACTRTLSELRFDGDTSDGWLKLAEVDLLLLSCRGKTRAKRADLCNDADRLIDEVERLTGDDAIGGSELRIAWYRFMVALHRPGGAKRSKARANDLSQLRPDIGAKAHKLRRHRRFLP